MSTYKWGAGYDLSLAASNHERTKKDNELAKQLMDYYYHGTEKSENERRRYDENYNLLAGRWPELGNYEKDYKIKFNGQEYGASGIKLRHFPVISQVTSAIYGDMAARKLIISLKDLSSASQNYRDRARLELTKGWFHQNLIEPQEQQIRMQYMMEMGVTDPTVLSIEDQQQMQADLQNRISEAVPQDLYDALEYINTPEEVIYRSFLDYLLEVEKVEDKFIIGGNDSIGVAEEYYKVFEHNGQPRVEVLNPKYVEWGGSEDTTEVERGDYATYEQYRTAEDIVSRYGKYLTKMDIKEIDALFLPNHKRDGYYQNDSVESQLQLSRVISENPRVEAALQEPLTKDGQDKLKYIYQHVLGRSHGRRNQNAGLKEKYITWRWQQWMYLVTREVNGKKKEFFKSGFYTKDPSKGDLKVQKILVPQIWHGTALGTERTIKLKVEPVPYQYKTLNNPFDVKLTIHGGKLNTFHNNTRNASFVDLGKPANYEYNTIKTFLENLRRSHIGKVMLMSPEFLPDNWTMGDFLKSIKITKTGLVNLSAIPNQTVKDSIHTVDFNEMPDIAATINQLEQVKNEVYESMLFNRAKLGQLGQYATATNSQLSVNASDTQLVQFHQRRKVFKESVIESALNLAVNLWKDNDDVKSVVLDDFSRAYLEANPDALQMADLALFVADDFTEAKKVEEVKLRMQEFMQNGGTAEDLIAISKADSMTELEQWARKFAMRNERMEIQRHERQMQLVNTEKEGEIQLEQLKRDVDLLIAQTKQQTDIEKANISADTLRRGYDVDNNKISDNIQSKILELEGKERILEKELAAERESKRQEIEMKREENIRKMELERKKLEIEKQKLKAAKKN